MERKKAQYDRQSKKWKGSSIRELLLKGIHISDTTAVALFGLSDLDKGVLHYANEAFLNIFDFVEQQYEEGVKLFMRQLQSQHGIDVIRELQNNEWKCGVTRHFQIPFLDEKYEENGLTAEVTYVEKQGDEMFFLVLLREMRPFPNIRMREPAEFDIICPTVSRGKLELYLQPKFSLTTRKVIGAEGLARCISSDGRVVLPAEFIPELEKTQQIIELDFYIYEQVLKVMKEWQQKGYAQLPISVNFSRAHIRNASFVSRIRMLTEQYGIDQKYIEIEITESILSSNDDKMVQDMAELQKSGFKVDIDDFGTGYSSLHMLLTAPVDIVKVDKSFLNDITQSEKNRKYVDCLGSLIQVTDKDIIVEGVETEHQAEILKDCGYTKAQGFLFGKAIPVEKFTEKYMKIRQEGDKFRT